MQLNFIFQRSFSPFGSAVLVELFHARFAVLERDVGSKEPSGQAGEHRPKSADALQVEVEIIRLYGARLELAGLQKRASKEAFVLADECNILVLLSSIDPLDRFVVVPEDLEEVEVTAPNESALEEILAPRYLVHSHVIVHDVGKYWAEPHAIGLVGRGDVVRLHRIVKLR